MSFCSALVTAFLAAGFGFFFGWPLPFRFRFRAGWAVNSTRAATFCSATQTLLSFLQDGITVFRANNATVTARQYRAKLHHHRPQAVKQDGRQDETSWAGRQAKKANTASQTYGDKWERSWDTRPETRERQDQGGGHSIPDQRQVGSLGKTPNLTGLYTS